MYDTGIAMHKCSRCQGMGLERGEQERLLPQAQELLGALQCLFREAGTASS
jgi:Zn-finger nucleic acid-binding protein